MIVLMVDISGVAKEISMEDIHRSGIN